MTQPLTDGELEHLLNFVGYGRLDADVWFLGMEEAGGGEENIRTRLQFLPVMDCAEAHRLLGVTNLHWGKRKIQRTWRGMCYTMLCLDSQKPTTENIRNYQAERLGRTDGNTLLAELMPIPKPKISKWGYEKFIPQYTSREAYYEIEKSRRVLYLQELLEAHKPKVIIGYGKGFWTAYKELFSSFSFAPDTQFDVAFDGKTVVVLSDHFTARTMNGKFGNMVAIINKYVTL